MIYDNWMDVYRELDEDFDRYPLPIEFDAHEELKQLNLRKSRLEEIAKRFFTRYKHKMIVSHFQNAPQPIKPDYMHGRFKNEN